MKLATIAAAVAIPLALLLASPLALAEPDEQFFEKLQTQPDGFAAIAKTLGCGHKYSEDKAAALFSAVKDRQVTATGEVARVDGAKVSLKVLPGTFTFDVQIKLVDASVAYDLEKGQRLSIRFTLKEHGGCFLPFSGDGGQIVPPRASAPQIVPPQASAPRIVPPRTSEDRPSPSVEPQNVPPRKAKPASDRNRVRGLY